MQPTRTQRECTHHWLVPAGGVGIDGRIIHKVIATCKLCDMQKTQVVDIDTAYRQLSMPTDRQCRRAARMAGHPKA